jgi:hypothetical protein
MSDKQGQKTLEEQTQTGFNPSDHLMEIKSGKGKNDYLPVQWRLVWFRQECPHGTIETEELEYDTEKECSVETSVWNNNKRSFDKVVKTAKGYARYRAMVTDGKGGRATGTKAECRASFEDYGEKAETGSIGRALAGLGFGTQFTADELQEGLRIVDAPVERTPLSSSSSEASSNGYQEEAKKAEATPAPKAANTQVKVSLATPPPVDTTPIERSEEELLTWQGRLKEVLGDYPRQFGQFAWKKAKADAGLPENANIWTETQLQRMLATCKRWTESPKKEDELLYQWQTSPCSDEQHLYIVTKFYSPLSYGKEATDNFIKQLGIFNGKPHRELQCHEVDQLIAILEKWLPLYELAALYDPGFAILQEKLKLSHPLELAGRDTKAHDSYVTALKSKITREKPLSEELRKKHFRAFVEMGIVAAPAKKKAA